MNTQETYCHLDRHRTHIWVDVTWKWGIIPIVKLCVRCECNEHYMHIHFPLKKWREALSTYWNW